MHALKEDAACGKTPTEAGEQNEEEEAEERSYYGLAINPHFLSPCTTVGEEVWSKE